MSSESSASSTLPNELSVVSSVPLSAYVLRVLYPMGWFGKFLHSGEFSDFTIVSSCGREFKTHRLMLAAHSKFFAEIFRDPESREMTENTLSFGDISGRTIQTILRWVYNNTYVEKKDITVELIEAINRFIMPSFACDIGEKITDRLTVDVACTRALYASKLNNSPAYLKIIQYFVKNQSKISETEDYKAMRTNEPQLIIELHEACMDTDCNRKLEPSAVSVSPRDWFGEYLDNGKLSDFTIVSSCGREFKTHRLILAAHSKFFAKIFRDPESREMKESKVSFGDISGPTIQTILQWMYSISSAEKCVNPQDVTIELIKVVKRFIMPPMVSDIAAVLSQDLTVDVACTHALLAWKLEHFNAYLEITKYFAKNKMAIMETEDYKTIYRNEPHLIIKLLEVSIRYDYISETKRQVDEDGEYGWLPFAQRCVAELSATAIFPGQEKHL